MPTWLRLLLSMVVLTGAGIAFIRVVFVRESGRKRLFPFVRPLYTHVFNPSALRAAAQGQTRWGVLHHVGRRSGAAYDTPIDAQRTPDGVVIGLVYGQSADWCRNILAADSCTLTLNGNDLALTAPQVISLSEAESLLSPERARFWRSIGIEHCVSLIIAPQAEAAPAGSFRAMT